MVAEALCAPTEYVLRGFQTLGCYVTMVSLYKVHRQYSLLPERMVKGCYAVSVTGRLPPGVVRDLRSKGIEYRQRDTSQKS